MKELILQVLRAALASGFHETVLIKCLHDALGALQFIVRVTAGLATIAMPTIAADDIYPSITVVDGPQVVFEHSKQKCEDIDIPDAPLRAFRRYDGVIVAFASHYRNRRLIGKSLSDLKHDCHVSYEGREDPDPSTFNDRTWIAATWTEDGRNIVALGHNEYQAQRFPGRCRYKTYTECWYNAIVLLKSTDSGENFARVDAASPMPLVAPPLKADAYQGRPSGYFEPSNIILSSGHYYTFIAQRGIDSNKTGRCLFRTRKLNSLTGWTFYDGHRFVPTSGNPYAGKYRHGFCEPVKGLPGVMGSVARIEGTNLFAAFTIDDRPGTPEGGAVEIAFSHDLINWNGNQVTLKLPPFWSSTSCRDGHKYNYVSVLDDHVQSMNFDSIGNEPLLFVTRSGCNVTLDRDLVSFRLRLSAPTTGPKS